LAQAETGLTIEAEHGLHNEIGGLKSARGAAMAALGRGREGVTEMRQDLAAVQGTGTKMLLPFRLASLAEGCGRTGEIEEGLALLIEALRLVDNTGERFYEAELHRLKGELTLQSGDPSQSVGVEEAAEECFQQALIIARAQQAKSWELRAAISLSRLWQRQGKKEETHGLLAEVFGWFTEGFDTGDLKEAKALLEELSA
jgi:predicted ATPase